MEERSAISWRCRVRAGRVHKQGQAMIEFVIAILMVVIVIAGVLQFVELAGVKGDLLAQIRSDAGEEAFGNRISLSTVPTYILDWQAGEDEIRHTADDTMDTGLAGNTLQQAVVNRSTAQDDDWRYVDEAKSDSIPVLHASTLPMSALGFIHAEAEETVTLLPAMRDWIIGKETVTVGTELWFPLLQLEGF
jgi:hypothetical protein